MKKNMMIKTCSILAIVAMATGCTEETLDRLKHVGEAPKLNPMAEQMEGSAPVIWPTGRMKQKEIKTVNSIWSRGAARMFADTRAREIGDILTVQVKLKEKANLDNKTERKRSNKDAVGAGSLFGLEELLTGWLPGKADPSSLISIDGSLDNKGEGKIEREEEIEFEVAAVVTQVLPNGNVMIYGSQEIRVNHEIRQITVEGVVRPGDIDANNQIDYRNIAEARISYGGRGLITDMQQPRLGSQVVDILSPF